MTPRLRGRLFLAGLPRVPYRAPDVATERAYERATAAWPPGGGPVDAPQPVLPYLRWLATTRPVVFHGSRTGGITEFSPERRSRDADAYGDQRAVFASQDPVWALFFATVERGEHILELRNGSLGLTPSPVGRRYFFSLAVADPRAPTAGPGFVYVLPERGFAHEPRVHGVDTAHRTHPHGGVRPLACIPVQAADFPLLAAVGRHEPAEARRRTLRRARSLSLVFGATKGS